MRQATRLKKTLSSAGWLQTPTLPSGIYQWYAGMTKWQYIAPLPYSFIAAEDTGAGTANAIKATSAIPVSGMALVLLNVYEIDTGSPVTVQFNGGPVLIIKTNTGQDVVAGGLPAGVVLLGRQVGSKFQLVSDIASAAIAAAAEVAKVAAQIARDQAVSAASSVQSEQTSRAFASANYHPLVEPDFIRTAAYAVAGDGGGALYKRIAADDATIPASCKFSITLSGSGTVVWYKLAKRPATAMSRSKDWSGRALVTRYSAMLVSTVSTAWVAMMRSTAKVAMTNSSAEAAMTRSSSGPVREKMSSTTSSPVAPTTITSN
jgi:hypothetical protein